MMIRVVLLIVLAGCYTVTPLIKLDPDAEKVVLTRNKPTDCSYLGEIMGKSINRKDNDANARNYLKNKALEVGGNVVEILTYGTPYSEESASEASVYNEVSLIGAVYKCSDRTVSSLPEF